MFWLELCCIYTVLTSVWCFEHFETVNIFAKQLVQLIQSFEKVHLLLKIILSTLTSNKVNSCFFSCFPPNVESGYEIPRKGQIAFWRQHITESGSKVFNPEVSVFPSRSTEQCWGKYSTSDEDFREATEDQTNDDISRRRWKNCRDESIRRNNYSDK